MRGQLQPLLLKNGRIYTTDGVLELGNMLVHSDGTIRKISQSIPDIEENTAVIELEGRNVLPGLIDVHIHGGDGVDVMGGSYEQLDEISRFHARHGTTALLATTSGCASEAETSRVIHCAAQTIRQGVTGAELVGIHLEGPFLNEKRRGAFNSDELRLPNRDLLERYLDAADGQIKLVTLAPELPGGYDLVKLLTECGVTVSIGHSDATYLEVVEAVHLGASHTTHHFNAMSPLNHREPGVAGAGLLVPELTAELIADGIHVHPDVVKLLFEIKGPSKVCIITDAVRFAGMPDGDYGRQEVVDGVVYLKGTRTLAGSTLTTIQALRNVIHFTGHPIEKVLPSFTSVPARQIGIGRKKGSLQVGKDADFLITDDALSVEATFVRGQRVYQA